MNAARVIRGQAGAAASLIEAVAVIAILAIVAAIALAATVQHIEDARLARAMADTQMIGIGIQSFKSGTARGPQDDFFLMLQSTGSDPGIASSLNWPADARQIDRLENQLIKNQPGGSGAPYPRMGQISYARFKGWDGPYFTTLPSDPWGDKYLVNAQLLSPKGIQMETSLTLGIGQRPAVFVVSAGPNRQLETKFDQIADQFVAGGDDIVYRIQ
jgi:type II secretory pathway pseudopilin PulG